MKKIIGILICIMLLATSVLTTLIIPEEIFGKADKWGGEPYDNTGLDFDYIWYQLGEISNVTYEAYLPEDIPKGRSFGSKGGIYTVEEILKKQMTGNLGLENVTTEQLQWISLFKRGYSPIINVTDFQITVYTEDDEPTYPFENPISKKEMFFIPTKGILPCSMTKDHEFENVTIVPKNLTKFFSPGGFKDFFNANLLRVRNYKLFSENLSIMAGVLSYIAPNEMVPDPEDQEGYVFLIDDIPGVQEKIDNITAADGVIIITGGAELEYTDISNCIYLVAGIDNDSGNAVKVLLNNHLIIVENIWRFGKDLTFWYNLDGGNLPLGSYMFIDRIPKHNELSKMTLLDNPLIKFIAIFGDLNFLHYWGCVGFWSLIMNGLNKILPFKQCEGIILYDSDDYHFMLSLNSEKASRIYRLPVYTFNFSVGDFLVTNKATTTLTGYANQEYLQEQPGIPGGIGENIYGNITIEKSPDDAIAIISNRYDGMWGQTPGDSGVGTAIVLGIAKYFNDHPSIKPKYNLTFLFTTAEEFGFRGAEYHCDKLSLCQKLKIKYWLMLDQLGFDQEDCKLCLDYRDPSINFRFKRILEEIRKDSGYHEDKIVINEGVSEGSEQGTVNKKILTSTTFCLVKDHDRRWDHWHRTGNNYMEGDSMANIDRDDVNATVRLTWGIVKYFMVHPDCWFEGPISYSHVDIDSDSNYDSINATFMVKTALPSDKVRVKATLKTTNNYTIFWKNFDFFATSEGTQKTITVTLLPTFESGGHYRLYLELFNSTGRIDENVYVLGGVENDSNLQSGSFYLHPRGNVKPDKPNDIQGPHTLQVFETGLFNSSTTDMNNDQLEYQWAWRKDKPKWWLYGVDNVGPYASGEICEIEHTYLSSGSKTVQVRAREDYRGQLYDGPIVLMSSKRFGEWSEWSNPFNIAVKLLTGLNMACTPAASAQNALGSTMLSSVVGVDSVYSAVAFGGNQPYNYTWDFDGCRYALPEKQVKHAFDEPGIKTVTLNVTDSMGYSEEITVNVSVVNLTASFNVSIPSDFTVPGEIIVFNDTSVARSNLHISNWMWDFGDGTVAYTRNASHSYEYLGVYNVTLMVTDNESGVAVCSRYITLSYDIASPEVDMVIHSPHTVGFGENVTIATSATDYESGVASVNINVTYPDNSSSIHAMDYLMDEYYCFVFNDTWQTGLYNYSIWAIDHEGNSNDAGGFNFTVTAYVTISVSTIKDTYMGDEYINLTDPPGDPEPSLGYELLDDEAVLHLWNQYDSYYFNTSSGIQLTNHKDEYWSRNVLMLGYYHNDQWNLLYRTDELTGFTKHIETDDATYVNITLWKDLSYGVYSFRLAIRYHLGANDNDLTIIPSIKNIGSSSIPYVLGFGWELKDIQINMTPQGDYILVDQDNYLLNQTLDNSYTSLNDTVFYLMENVTGSQTKSLYLRWNPDLTYKLLVKSRSGQQNAPVTLFIRVGTLAVGQQKHTRLQWYDASQETFYFNGFDENEAWEFDPELMTDGDVETFAKSCSNNEVEFCTLNTYEGDGRGAILKVELRMYGYYDDEQGNITLVPVFGENRGENYTFVPTDQAEWSSWFDITNDEGRGSGQWITPWEWSEVETLRCYVISHASKGTTLYCSKVELRVTYNTAPVVSNPSPLYGVNGVGLQPWVNITVSDPDGDSMNVTWYSNSTPSLLTLRPNANGSSTQLSRHPGSAAANYLCVDEAVADDADYVHWSGTTWKKDTYNLANRGTASGVIHGVTVYARCNRGGIGMDPSVPNQGKIVIKSGSGYYDGNEFTPTSTFTSYSHTWSVNPATGNPWSWSAVDALEAGIAFIGNEAGDCKCSQMYVVVNYTDPNTWLQFGQNSSVSNGIYRQQFLNASVNGQWWYWKVKVEDGTASTWSSVYKFYTGYQSKIENTGETTIKGYLLMQVQYYNETLESWIVDNDTVNETSTRTITSGNQLALDTIFNGQVRASDLTHGTGTYRVYAAFRDPEGNILNTSDQTKLEAWWQFSKT